MKKKFIFDNLIAHRGKIYNNVIENTLPAFFKCIEKEYIIELDIHMLKDKTIIVYHDYNLKRLCGINKILENCTYDEIKKYKINNKYTIPTLKQVINMVSGKTALLIEIKDLNNSEILLNELFKVLNVYNGEYAIISFNPYVIKRIIKKRKKILCGIIIYNFFNYKMIKKIVKKSNIICVNKKALPFKSLSRYIIIGWTIKTKEEYCKYKHLCDNLICEKIL